MDSLASLAFVACTDESGNPVVLSASEITDIIRSGGVTQVYLRNGRMRKVTDTPTDIHTDLDAVRDVMLAGL